MTSKIRLTFICFIGTLPVRLLAQAPVISYSSPQTYNINTPITPLSPTNTGGVMPTTVYGQVSTLAGNGNAEYTDGSGTAASFHSPINITTSASGTLYITDNQTYRIRRITLNGFVSVFSGLGFPLSLNGSITSATFSDLYGITFDNSGNLFVSDNNEIRKISTAGAVTTFAGRTTPGFVNDNGTNARFNSPGGLCTDDAENIYVADVSNNMIRKITPTGQVSTFAGNGTSGYNDGPAASATFNSPSSVSTDAAGNIYVADPGNNLIRKITRTGVVSTLTGTGASGHNDGPAASASFYSPEGIICTDKAGNIYVSEGIFNDIRKISHDGQVTTLAGSGTAGSTDAIGIAASFHRPIGIAENNGQLYVADYLNNKIRLISVTGYTIDHPLPPGLTFDTTTGIISGTPTAIAAAAPYVITAYNGKGSRIATVIIGVNNTGMLLPSVITFTGVQNQQADANSNITPVLYSTNPESPIILTSSDTQVATITPDGLIHLVGPGLVTITANQAGSEHYSTALPVSIYLTVTQQQHLTFPPIATKTLCDVDFSAGVSSNAHVVPVTYSSSHTDVATISPEGIIHILKPGTTVITAMQADGEFYAAATDVSQTLTVIAPVNPTINITPANYSTCDGLTITYTANITNGGSSPVYEWKVNNVSSGNSPTFTSSALHNNDVITCTVTNTTDCSTAPTASVSTTVTIKPYVAPTISIQASVNTRVCSGTGITFTATSNIAPDADYQWLVNGTASGSNSNVFTTTALNDGDVVTCNLTAHANACVIAPDATSNAITAGIITNDIPDVSVSASANTIYADMPVTFTATIANNIINPYYQWQVNNINAGTNSTLFTSSRLHTGDRVACTITSVAGCVAPTTSQPIIMTVLPPPSVKVYNTFTPNGDGINDLWNIPDLEYYPNCRVSIYDRSGSIVYQSNSGYGKPWDGTQNGRQLPVATYYYIINLNNKSAPLSGSVTIIR